MRSQYRLFTPIANAWEAYRRRRTYEPNHDYEHVWRLIHVCEALVVSLGYALATRLLRAWRGDSEKLADLNRLRALMTGLSEPDGYEDETLQHSVSYCLDGRLQEWINLLRRFGTQIQVSECQFCRALEAYLNDTEPQDPLGFAEAWKNIAPVPKTYQETLKRVERFEAINSLRNKIAHVPLPERVLDSLHAGLLREVKYALSPDQGKTPGTRSEEESLRITRWHDILCAQIALDGISVTGSDFWRTNAYADKVEPRVEIQPLIEGEDKSWNAAPFFMLDSECKVSVLFRISEEIDVAADGYKGEYHRFAAEFKPVHTHYIPAELLRPWFPQSAIGEENTSSEPNLAGVETTTREETEAYDLETGIGRARLRADAEDAFRGREYGRAVKLFKMLADAKTEGDCPYNDVAKSKHGAALWRYAVLHPEVGEDRSGLLQTAIDLLKEATKHIDPRHRARSFYELSKAYHKVWKLGLGDQFELAKEAAKQAADCDHRFQYVTWLERLEEEKEAEGTQ